MKNTLIVLTLAAALFIAGCIQTQSNPPNAMPLATLSATPTPTTSTPTAQSTSVTPTPSRLATDTPTSSPTTKPSAIRTETPDAYCTDEFHGIVCEGVCFSTPGSACINGQLAEPQFSPALMTGIVVACTQDSECKSYVYNGNTIATHCDSFRHICQPPTPGDDFRQGVTYTAQWPESVPANSDFKVTITVENRREFPRSSELEGVRLLNQIGALGNGAGDNYQYAAPLDDTNRHANLKAREKKTFEYAMKAGPATPAATLVLMYPFNRDIQIVVYDPALPTAQCGNKTYNPVNSECQNGVLYPVSKAGICKADADCGSHRCLDGLCVRTADVPPHGLVKIALTPLYFSNGQAEFDKLRLAAEAKVATLAKTANAWWKAEKARHLETDLELRFEYVPCATDTSAASLRSDLEQTYRPADFLALEAKRCELDANAHPIRVFVPAGSQMASADMQAQFSKMNWPVSAGLNVGSGLAMVSAQDEFDQPASIVIHEALHSFGQVDLYPYNGVYAADYQLRGCLLYGPHPQDFDGHSELCPFEAKILGLEK